MTRHPRLHAKMNVFFWRGALQRQRCRHALGLTIRPAGHSRSPSDTDLSPAKSSRASKSVVCSKFAEQRRMSKATKRSRGKPKASIAAACRPRRASFASATADARHASCASASSLLVDAPRAAIVVGPLGQAALAPHIECCQRMGGGVPTSLQCAASKWYQAAL
jgi:hypothetical protein